MLTFIISFFSVSHFIFDDDDDDDEPIMMMTTTTMLLMICLRQKKKNWYYSSKAKLFTIVVLFLSQLLFVTSFNHAHAAFHHKRVFCERENNHHVPCTTINNININNKVHVLTSPLSLSASAEERSPRASNTGSVGLTDDEFRAWLHEQLEDAPARNNYQAVYEKSIDAMVNWRKRYRGNPRLWKRIFKKDRVLKELIESAPIIDIVMKYVESYSYEDEQKKITIMDLCSGKGYLSMFLSEILPKDKVEKMILIDKAWAMCNTKELRPHHINWDHIYGKVQTIKEDENMFQSRGQQVMIDLGIDRSDHDTYFTTWPIPLHTSKQDLKQSCNQRQMKKYFFDRIDGPIIILAIHLCGTLSLKAVDMFNNHNNVHLFALKPCCLPKMIYAQRGDVFKIGQHEFRAEEVCSNGEFNKKDWSGPPRWHLEGKFDKWTNHLYDGVNIGDLDSDTGGNFVTHGRKAKENIGKEFYAYTTVLLVFSLLLLYLTDIIILLF